MATVEIYRCSGCGEASGSEWFRKAGVEHWRDVSRMAVVCGTWQLVGTMTPEESARHSSDESRARSLEAANA